MLSAFNAEALLAQVFLTEYVATDEAVNVGVRNFQRFFADPSFRGPLFLVFIWTFCLRC